MVNVCPCKCTCTKRHYIQTFRTFPFDYRIICFYTLFIRVISLAQWYQVWQIAMEKDNKFELYFLIICRYLNLVENQRMISQQIKISQVVTALKVVLCFGHGLFTSTSSCHRDNLVQRKLKQNVVAVIKFQFLEGDRKGL